MRILLTGERGVGKSTLARNVFEKLAISPDGFKTFPVYEDKQKAGFYLQDLQTGEKFLFAHRNFKGGEKFSEFGVYDKVFENFSALLLKKASSKGGYILIDEVGVMEMNSAPFLEALIHLWKSPLRQLWVVQKRSPFLKTLTQLHEPFQLFEVTPRNRDFLADEIIALILSDFEDS